MRQAQLAAVPLYCLSPGKSSWHLLLPGAFYEASPADGGHPLLFSFMQQAQLAAVACHEASLAVGRHPLLLPFMRQAQLAPIASHCPSGRKPSCKQLSPPVAHLT